MKDNNHFRDHIQLWNAAAVKVLDVRHASLSTGELHPSYRFPASGFIFTTRGSARLWLDRTEYSANRYHVLHAGKGTCLDIYVIEEPFEYVLIYYKASLPLPGPSELLKRLDEQRPFQLQYGFVPPYPVKLLENVSKMQQEWTEVEALAKLHVKTLFLQFVYELLSQLQEQIVHPVKPNVTEQALRYMEDHYEEPITLDGLAQMFNYSTKNFAKLFKKQTGCSPIDYLIQTRMDKARNLLKHTELLIYEVAKAVGYSDQLYFARIFKKHCGCSPVQYKDAARQGKEGANHPYELRRLSIVPVRPQRYIGNNNRYQYTHRGDLHMNKYSNSSLVISMLLSLTLVLSACGVAPNTANSGGNATTHSSSATEESGNSAVSKTTKVEGHRIIKHMFGETKLPDHWNKLTALYPRVADNLLALGIEPYAVSAAYNDKFPPYLEKMMDEKGIKKLGPGFPVNLEEILAAEPDLLVGWSYEEKDYNELAKIAPTVVYAEDMWREALPVLAAYFGKEEQAKQVTADYEAKADGAKAKLDQAVANQSVLFLRVADDELIFFALGDTPVGRVLYQDLKLQFPAGLNPDESGYLSLEVLPDINPDIIFVELHPSEAIEQKFEELTSSVIWKNLNAIKNEQVFIIDHNQWMQGGVLGSSTIIDEVVERLVIDGVKN